MVSIRDVVLSAVCVLSLAMVAPAQGELEVDAQVLPAGGEVELSYSNSQMSGGTIQIKIENGDPETYEIVLIQLNSAGQGENSWEVPEGWELAYFRSPQAEPVLLFVGEGN